MNVICLGTVSGNVIYLETVSENVICLGTVSRCMESLGMWEDVLSIVDDETGNDESRLFVQDDNWDGGQYLRYCFWSLTLFLGCLRHFLCFSLCCFVLCFTTRTQPKYSHRCPCLSPSYAHELQSIGS